MGWASIIGAITAIAGLGTWAVKYMLDRAQRKRDLEQQELGRKDARLDQVKQDLEAEERMKKARQAPGVDDAEKRLGDGTF